MLSVLLCLRIPWYIIECLSFCVHDMNASKKEGMYSLKSRTCWYLIKGYIKIVASMLTVLLFWLV